MAKARASPTLAGLSLLERSAVRQGTETKYQVELQAFTKASEGRPLVVDSEVDDALVLYMNELYENGHHSSRGDDLLWALLHVTSSRSMASWVARASPGPGAASRAGDAAVGGAPATR